MAHRKISFAMLVTGIILIVASFFTEADAEPVCVNAFPPYEVSLQTKCAIETLAGSKSIECGTLKPERRP